MNFGVWSVLQYIHKQGCSGSLSSEDKNWNGSARAGKHPFCPFDGSSKGAFAFARIEY
jgi:hypothetical protein